MKAYNFRYVIKILWFGLFVATLRANLQSLTKREILQEGCILVNKIPHKCELVNYARGACSVHAINHSWCP